jgi:hypothetical protein
MKRVGLLTLALAACTPAAPAPQQGEPPAQQVPPAAIAPVGTLAGKWRIARIDGEPLAEQNGMGLEASDSEIWWSPRCAGFVRSYRIDGSDFSTGPHLGWEPPRPGAPPAPVCAIAPPPRIGEVFQILTEATDIRRTAESGVEISGRGRSLLLFTL